MKRKKPGIRTDLVKLWRTNVADILQILHYTQADLAEAIGLSRQSVSKLFNDSEYRMTAVQFLGSIYGIEELINESDRDERFKTIALSLLDDLDKEYKQHGLH